MSFRQKHMYLKVVPMAAMAPAAMLSLLGRRAALVPD